MRQSPGAPDCARGAPLVRPRDPAAAARALLPLGVAAKAGALLPLGAAAKAGALLPLGAAAAALVLLLPAATVDRSPIAVPIGLGLLLALSIARPPLGLVVVAALVPVSSWITHAASLEPLRLAEALVLAGIGGACLRLAFGPRVGVDRYSLPAGVAPAAGTVIAVAGAAVVVELVPAQAGLSGTWLLVSDATGQLATDYLYGTATLLPGLPDAALLMEGVGLVLVVAVWSSRHAALPRWLVGASLAGAGAAAAVNLDVVAGAVAAAADPLATLGTYLRGGQRLAGHVPDFNATGAYFLMLTLAGLGLSAGRAGARIRALPALATLAAGAAFWLAGSRAALAAVVLAGAAVTVCRLRAARPGGRVPGRRRTALLAGAALVLVALPIVVVAAFPERGGFAGAATGMRFRTEFTATSLRMWATAPTFGVGAGRYHGLSDQFMGPWLAERYRRENAHNNFLQIAAELGAVGIAGFVWLLVVAGRRVWSGLGNRPRPDPLLLGTSVGVAAFLVTCLAGHPLLVPETAYPFWILAGVAVALAQTTRPAPLVRPRRHAVAAGACGLFLLVTFPLRIDAAAQTMMRDTARTGIDGIAGTYALEIEPSGGRRFRWTGPRATFFAPAAAEQARIRLRALQAGPGRRVAVDVAIDGRRVMRIPMLGPDWVEVAAPLAGTRSTRALARVDLLVDPPWKPHERDNGDPRTLGVMIEAIAFTPAAVPAPAAVQVPVVR